MRIKKTSFFFFLISILAFFIAFIIWGFFDCQIVFAGESKYLQQSNIDSRKEVIHAADGKPDGYLQQSPIDPRKTVEYDKKGNIKGTWQKSHIDPRKTIFTEKD